MSKKKQDINKKTDNYSRKSIFSKLIDTVTANLQGAIGITAAALGGVAAYKRYAPKGSNAPGKPIDSTNTGGGSTGDNTNTGGGTGGSTGTGGGEKNGSAKCDPVAVVTPKGLIEMAKQNPKEVAAILARRVEGNMDGAAKLIAAMIMIDREVVANIVIQRAFENASFILDVMARNNAEVAQEVFNDAKVREVVESIEYMHNVKNNRGIENLIKNLPENVIDRIFQEILPYVAAEILNGIANDLADVVYNAMDRVGAAMIFMHVDHRPIVDGHEEALVERFFNRMNAFEIVHVLGLRRLDAESVKLILSLMQVNLAKIVRAQLAQAELYVEELPQQPVRKFPEGGPSASKPKKSANLLTFMEPAEAAIELVDMRPEEAAERIEQMPLIHAANIFVGMSPAEAARIIECMDPAKFAKILEHMRPVRAASIFALMNPQKAAKIIEKYIQGQDIKQDIFAILEKLTKAIFDNIFECSNKETKAELNALLAERYPDMKSVDDQLRMQMAPGNDAARTGGSTGQGQSLADILRELVVDHNEAYAVDILAGMARPAAAHALMVMMNDGHLGPVLWMLFKHMTLRRYNGIATEMQRQLAPKNKGGRSPAADDEKNEEKKVPENQPEPDHAQRIPHERAADELVRMLPARAAREIEGMRIDQAAIALVLLVRANPTVAAQIFAELYEGCAYAILSYMIDTGLKGFADITKHMPAADLAKILVRMNKNQQTALLQKIEMVKATTISDEIAKIERAKKAEQARLDAEVKQKREAEQNKKQLAAAEKAKAEQAVKAQAEKERQEKAAAEAVEKAQAEEVLKARDAMAQLNIADQVQRFNEMDLNGADRANAILLLMGNAAQIIAEMDPDRANMILARRDAAGRAQVFNVIPADRAAAILNTRGTDYVAQIINEMGPVRANGILVLRQDADQILARIDQDRANVIRNIRELNAAGLAPILNGMEPALANDVFVQRGFDVPGMAEVLNLMDNPRVVGGILAVRGLAGGANAIAAAMNLDNAHLAPVLEAMPNNVPLVANILNARGLDPENLVVLFNAAHVGHRAEAQILMEMQLNDANVAQVLVEHNVNDAARILVAMDPPKTAADDAIFVELDNLYAGTGVVIQGAIAAIPAADHNVA